jgi:chromosome segregation ATPase
LSWSQWTEACIDARIEQAASEMGKVVGELLTELRRELGLLQRELTQLREQVGLERGLRDLRTEVEQARAEVPQMPKLMQKLEESQARLVGESPGPRTQSSVCEPINR